MSRVIYLPIEHEDTRYTEAMDVAIISYLEENHIPFTRISPSVDMPWTAGSFLNAPKTIRVKALQIAELARMFGGGEVSDGDIVFCSDIWMPGIEAVAYLNFFCGKRVSLRGFVHAGSFTDTDFVRDMERWAKGFEDSVFDIADKLYVGSNFIRNDILKKRMVPSDKVVVSGLPMDTALNSVPVTAKENIVVFNGRNCDEKQPWLFDEIAVRIRAQIPEAVFINTQRQRLQKKSYYDLLARAKVVVSFALQENFGYGVAEAVALGCRPVLPDRLVYPELYEQRHLYKTMDECEALIISALHDPPAQRKFIDNTNVFEKIFGGLK